jgi:hypothetical protein
LGFRAPSFCATFAPAVFTRLDAEAVHDRLERRDVLLDLLREQRQEVLVRRSDVLVAQARRKVGAHAGARAVVPQVRAQIVDLGWHRGSSPSLARARRAPFGWPTRSSRRTPGAARRLRLQEAALALARPGRYRTVAGNLPIKDVVLDDGTMRDAS